MSNKNQKLPQTTRKDESRVLPLLFAGLFCFVIAALIGFGTWRVFGSQARENGDTAKFLQKFGLEIYFPIFTNQPIEPIAQSTPQNEQKDLENKEANNNAEIVKEDVQTSVEIEGVVSVEGKEVTVGGGQTERPIQRIIVENFLIAETEVTNAQYAEFINATGHRSPIGWNKAKFPKDTEDFPVVNVSWSDADAFCQWLGEQYKMKVRLPNQAEWELAASGPNRFKYPWGNDWNDDGVEKQKDTKANKVKKYPMNRSPFGAYDMLGNVWEWTSEEIKKKELESDLVKNANRRGNKFYLALGGSFIEDRKDLKNTFWAELGANLRDNSLGFRYVIIPNETNNN